jgi:hypothetical protein
VFIDGFNKKNNYINDNYLVENCSIYTSLVKNILYERRAPLKDAFFYFCKMAGYSISCNIAMLDKKTKQEINDMFVGDDVIYGFDNIPLETNSTIIDQIQQKIFASEATLEEILILYKFFFVKKFKNVLDDNEKLNLAFSWNRRYQCVLESLESLTFDNPISNTINKLSKLNNWNNVIPEDDDELNDIKLTDELKKEIIDNFHLNGVKIEKASNKILFKNADNTFFKKEVIKTKPVGDNKKHYEYFIDDNIRMMFEFGLRCLKAYHEELKPDLSFDQFIDDDEDLSQMSKLLIKYIEESIDCDMSDEDDDDNLCRNI